MNLKKMVLKVALKAKKNAPEILLVTGVVAGVATVVTACVQTTKASDIIEDHNKRIDEAHRAREIVVTDGREDDYTESDEKKNVIMAYTRTGWNMIKLYALPGALGSLSLACIFASYGILKKRNAALTAAYTSLYGAFKAYRTRVLEEEGRDADIHYLTGAERHDLQVTTIDEKGKEKKTTVTDVVIPDNYHSDYAFFFDESNPNWVRDASLNKAFLAAQQRYLNDKYHAQGHLFLNEVFDALQLPHTTIGSIVGWIEGEGDEDIDLGIYDATNPRARDFVNGYERSILLDPNLDGIIYDRI